MDRFGGRARVRTHASIEKKAGSPRRSFARLLSSMSSAPTPKRTPAAPHNPQTHTETPETGGTNRYAGTPGIRFQHEPPEPAAKRTSAPADGDSEVQSACGSIPSPCNHAAEPENSSDHVSEGPFLTEEFSVPGPVVDVFGEIYGDYHRDDRLGVAHVMACQDQYTAVGFEEGDRVEDDFVPLPTTLRNSTIPQSDPAALTEDGVLESKVFKVGNRFLHYKPGKSMAFRVPRSLLSEMMERRMRSLRQKTRYDLMEFAATLDKSGARMWSPPSTQLTDETGHASPKRDTTMRSVMERVDQMRVDFEAMETFALTLQEELRSVEDGVAERFSDFKETLPDFEADADLSDEQSRKYRQMKEVEETAQARQATARHVVCNTAEQVTEWHGDGTATALIKLEQRGPYSRLYHGGTYLQSGSRELKTCAFAGVNAYNCDLDSCFDRILRSLLEEAGIDCPQLDGWVSSDHDWKQEIADDCGVSRGTVKSFAHRTKFALRPPQPNPIFEAPARSVKRDVGDGWEDSFELLKERFSPVFKAVQDLRDYLTGPWLEEEAYPGGNGKQVKGRTGARLRVDDPPDDLRKDLLTFRLFDEEQAFIQTLVQVLHDDHGVATYSLEHDGIVTAGPVPGAAIRETKERTGLDYMKLDRRESIRDGYTISRDEAEPEHLAKMEAEEQREKVRQLIEEI